MTFKDKKRKVATKTKGMRLKSRSGYSIFKYHTKHLAGIIMKEKNIM